MGRLRIGILIFFFAVAAFFGASYIYDKVTVDTEAPVITADKDVLHVSVKATDEDLLAGLNATDNMDGDVTHTIVVVSRGKFIEPGVLHVKYAAFDRSNNVGTKTREVIMDDYTPPKFSLNAPLRYIKSGSGYDYIEHLRAVDCIDGDITSQIKFSLGKINAVSDTSTQQTMNLQVTNSCGDSSVIELLLSLEDYTSYNVPAPSLKEYLIYVPKDSNVDFKSYINGIWIGGTVKSFEEAETDISRISVISGSVNTAVPGIYRATYRLSGENGGTLGSATLYVVVEG